MAGIIEIDVHGKDVETAIREIRQRLNNAGTGTYRIRSMAIMEAQESGRVSGKNSAMVEILK